MQARPLALAAAALCSLVACTASHGARAVVAAPAPVIDVPEPDAPEPAPDAVASDEASLSVDAAPPDAAASAPPAALSPARPSITFRDQQPEGGLRFHAEGFPAQSADGRTVAVTVVGTAPMQGNALRVLFLDAVTGHTARSFVAADNRESELIEGGELTAAQIATFRERASAIGAALDALHARPLVATPIAEAECDDCDPDRPVPRTANVAGLSVQSLDGALTVRRGPASSRPLVRRALPAMRRGCAGVNVPYLAGLFVVAPERLLLHVEYRGNDRCWEGPGVWEIQALPAGRR